MSIPPRFIAILFCFVLVLPAQSQIMQDARSLEQGALSFHLAGAVFAFDGVSTLTGHARVRYGLSERIDLTLRAGISEVEDTYGGAQLDILMRDEPPFVSLSAGGHFQKDPAVDGTLNATWPLPNNIHIYSGVDFDLVFDDDPDLPAWAFLGTLLPIRRSIDINLEIAVGLVPIASEVFTAGFVFSF